MRKEQFDHPTVLEPVELHSIEVRVHRVRQIAGRKIVPVCPTTFETGWITEPSPDKAARANRDSYGDVIGRWQVQTHWQFHRCKPATAALGHSHDLQQHAQFLFEEQADLHRHRVTLAIEYPVAELG